MAMDLTAAKESSTALPNALPEAWAERIFQRMEDRYGSLWVDRYGAFPRERIKRAWAEDLADMSKDELARGVSACRDAKFPPTLPEFRALCRPPLDYEAAFLEAVEQMRLRDEGRDKWTSAVVYWAAVRLGRDMQNAPYAALKGRWHVAVDAAAAQVAAGELPAQVPARTVALPSPGGTSASKERVREHLAAVVVSLKATKSDPLAWARKLLDRKASGEDIGLQSELMAQRAFGLDHAG